MLFGCFTSYEAWWQMPQDTTDLDVIDVAVRGELLDFHARLFIRKN
jgi:hypothetical protein